MSKIIGFEGNRKAVDMDKITAGDLLNKMFDYTVRWDDLIKGQISALEGATDEGTVICDKEGTVIAATTSEKLAEVIKELEGIKKEAEMIESFEGFIYE